MAELMKHITDESNGLTYTLHGDYYLPELELPNESRPIGKYGMMRKEYLEKHRPGLYARLMLSGKLMSHLADTNEQANKRLASMLARMAAAEGVDEELKARDPMRWVGLMNNLKACAEECILAELVYA